MNSIYDKDLPRSPANHAPLSPLSYLERAAEVYPERLAIVHGQGAQAFRQTWGQTYQRCRRLASALQRAGIARNDTVAVMLPNTPPMAEAHFGIPMAGAVLNTLNTRLDPEAIAFMLDHGEAKAILVDPEFAGVVKQALSLRTLGTPLLVIETTDALYGPSSAALGGTDYEAFLAGGDPAFAWELPGDEWDAISLNYTSGTTGNPKGVMLKHGTILSTLEGITKILPLREHRTVSLLPPSHLFEQAPVLMFGTMIGAHILFVRSRNPRVIFDALKEERVTTMVLVPQLVELFWLGLMREVKRQGKEKTFERARRIARHLPYWARRLIFRSVHKSLGGALNLMVSAGAYLPPALQQGWEDLGVVVVQGYGATECGPAAATSEQDHPQGTVGKTPYPVTLRLASGTNEIEVGGPTVFDGYWKDPAATAAVMTADGWYRTGDVGRFDGRGNLVLQGRTKNIIVLPNGFNVFPEDIENVLSDVGLEQAVVIETEPGRLEAIVLSPDTPPVITPNSPAPAAPQTDAEMAALRARIEPMVKAANARLGQQQRLADFRVWPEPDFPRTHTLKIRRGEVAKWAGSTVALQHHDTP